MTTENISLNAKTGADINLATKMLSVPANTGTDTGIPTGSGKLIIIENIMVTNVSQKACQYILTYENSYSSYSNRLFVVMVNPNESVILAKKTQPVLGSNKTFFHKASAPNSLTVVYSYRELS